MNNEELEQQDKLIDKLLKDLGEKDTYIHILEDKCIELATNLDALTTDYNELKMRNIELEALDKINRFRIDIIDAEQLISKSKLQKLLDEDNITKEAIQDLLKE